MSIKKLVIPREKWGQGWMKREDGAMCCLGHLAAACGYTCLNASAPGPGWDKIPAPLLTKDFIGEAIRINDSLGMPSLLRNFEQKEAELVALFGSHGVYLSFSGEHVNSNWDSGKK